MTCPGRHAGKGQPWLQVGFLLLFKPLVDIPGPSWGRPMGQELHPLGHPLEGRPLVITPRLLWGSGQLARP